MNARNFINLSLQEIQLLDEADYPQWAAVLAILNKKPDNNLLAEISSFPGKTTQEKLYNAINKSEIGKCKACENPTTFLRMKHGYSLFCSQKCSAISDETKAKRTSTNLDRYGVENCFQSEEKKDKAKTTSLKRFGVEYYLQSEEGKNKSRAFFIEQHGVEHNSQIPEVKLKIAETNTIRYGNKCSLQGIDIRAKSTNTLLNKYGVHHNSQIPEVKKKKSESLKHYKRTSKFEEEIVTLIRRLGYTGMILRNVRTIIRPLEIDIYLPELKLGIECCGVYWHSFPYKSAEYHKQKADLSDSAGIKLIQLFDTEWIDKREIVIHRLKSLLSLGRRIFARKTLVRKITSIEMSEFCKNYHGQGWAVAKHNYGLYHGDELVAAMSFSKPRYNKKYQFELIRYVSSCNVIGGASKLLKAFIDDQKPLSIMTYADRRWSNGNLYDKLGFKLDSVSKPCYWYFKGNEFRHRSTFQKHKLSKLLEIFNPNKTEYENMSANKWKKIYDAGSKIYVMHL